MKKIIYYILITISIFLFIFMFIYSKNQKSLPFRIGSTTPGIDILNNLKSDFVKAGLKIEIIEFSDYTSPNIALANKQIDANFFQHKPFLDNFKESRHLKLTGLSSVALPLIGIYSKKIKSINSLKDRATIGLSDDPTNLARSLLVLQDSKLIKLDPKKGLKVQVEDIIENNKHLKFKPVTANKLFSLLDDKDIDATFINGNFAVLHGLNPTKDSIYLEKSSSPFANIVAVRTGDEDDKDVITFMKILRSEKTKKFINEKYKGILIPTF